MNHDIRRQSQDIARVEAAMPLDSASKQVQEIERAKRAVLSPSKYKIDVNEALRTAEIGRMSAFALSNYQTPSVLRADEELRRQNLASINNVNEMNRQGTFRGVFESMQDAQRHTVQNILKGQYKSARETLVGNVFDYNLKIQDFDRMTSSGWLQDSLLEARQVLSSSDIQSLFKNLENIENLLQQAERLEADAAEVESELPENFGEQALVRLDMATLLFITQYFNGIFTYVVIGLMVASMGSGPQSTLDNLNKGAQLAKMILIEAEKALQEKVDEEDNE